MSILNKTKNRIDLFVTEVLVISARKLLVKVNTEQKTMHSQRVNQRNIKGVPQTETACCRLTSSPIQ